MKKLIEWSPLYSLLIFFCSYIINDNYYKNFGIDISKYVEFSDMLLFTLPLIRDLIYAALTALVLQPSLLLQTFSSIVKSPRALVIQEFHNRFRKKHNLILEVKFKDFRTRFNEFENDAIGFHLLTNINTLYNKNSRGRLSKNDFIELLVITIIIIAVTLACWVILGSLWVKNFIAYQRFGLSTTDNRLYDAICVVLIPIALIVGTACLFGVKHNYRNYYKFVITPQVIPIVMISLITLIGIVLNKYKFSDVKSTKINNYVAIYKGSDIIKSSKKSKFIGRTKNHVFFLEKDNIKSINISEADSVIFDSNNKIL